MKASKQPSIFQNLHQALTMSSERTFSPSSYHIQGEKIQRLSPMAVSNVSGRLFPRMGYVAIRNSQRRSWLNNITYHHHQLLHKQVLTKTSPRTPVERKAFAILLGQLSMYFFIFLGLCERGSVWYSETPLVWISLSRRCEEIACHVSSISG